MRGHWRPRHGKTQRLAGLQISVLIQLIKLSQTSLQLAAIGGGGFRSTGLKAENVLVNRSQEDNTLNCVTHGLKAFIVAKVLTRKEDYHPPQLRQNI